MKMNNNYIRLKKLIYHIESNFYLFWKSFFNYLSINPSLYKFI